MKTSFLKSISLIIILAGSTPTIAVNPAVIIVDGQKFTYSQIMDTKSFLPTQYQSEPEEKIFPILLSQMIAAYLINKEAQSSGEAKKPDIQKAIAKAAEQIISQTYLSNKVKDGITDTSIQAKYNEVIKNFPPEKEVHLRHILVDSKETALSILKALKGKADFKTLAQSKSKDKTAKDGDLGFMRKSVLPKEVAEVAFATTPGSYAKEPVKTDFGWHVLKVEEVREAKIPEFEEVKEKIKMVMTQEAINAHIKDLISKAKIELYDKDGKLLPLKEAS